MAVPPVGTVYQRYSPGDAPDDEKVNEDPLQKGPLTVGTVGSAGTGLMVATTSVREALSQFPLWRVTKKEVVVVIDGVINKPLTSPVRGNPPTAPAYHR